MTEMPPNELDILTRASAGLEYPSESDAPFDAFLWKANDKRLQDVLKEHAGKNRTIQEVPVNQFFAQLKDSDDAKRFAELGQVLESHLTDLHVFRATDGSAKVDIYLVGKTPPADWAGLHTISVET